MIATDAAKNLRP